MSNKKLFWIFLPIALIIVAVFILVPKSEPAGDQGLEKKQTFDPQKPNFLMGTVNSSSATSIEFVSGQTPYSAQISGNTKLVKQVMENGVVKLADATVEDIKQGALIVVYFSTPAQNNIYQADKIQIIN